MDMSTGSQLPVLVLLGLLVVPLIAVAALNRIFRKRGGIGGGWGGAIFVGLCWITAVIVILVKIA